MKKVFSVPLIIAVALAISALIGFPVGATEAIIIAVAAFAAAVREYFASGGFRFVWSREVWLYISAALLLVLPYEWLADLLPFLGDLIDAIINFDLQKIITIVLLIVSYLFNNFSSKKTDNYTTELQEEKEADDILGDA